MTRAAHEPGPFRKGQRLLARDLNAIVNAVIAMLRERIGVRLFQPANIMVVLDGDLDAATDKSNSPATATGSVWQKNSSGNLADTGRNETIVNRFEHIAIVSGTLIKAEWIDGEWQPYASDCEE